MIDAASYPLIDGPPQEHLLHLPAGSVSRAQFMAQVQGLAQTLPAGVPLLNLCESRDAFLLAFCAIALRGSVNLLPPSAAPDLLRQIAASAGAAGAVAEREDTAAGLRWFSAPRVSPGGVTADIPALPESRVVAWAYTSGSTGMPQPHAKTWGELVRTSQLAAQRFLQGMTAPPAIIGTVPPQHMYGLETTVMLPLVGAAVATPSKPLLPADLADALAAVPAPRVLITTPVHLRACVRVEKRLPALSVIISATAPLPLELAQSAEALLACGVQEIYGCTEAGSMASRQLTRDAAWRPYDGIHIQPTEAGADITAQHLPKPIRVQDRIECHDDGRFILLGRGGDLLKVAGKRISLAELTAQLSAIPGVEDAVVFQPDSGDVVQRPAALVVAPALGENDILDALARRVDPVFLPRPLRKVVQLPRNAVGKLPLARLMELLHG